MRLSHCGRVVSFGIVDGDDALQVGDRDPRDPRESRDPLGAAPNHGQEVSLRHFLTKWFGAKGRIGMESVLFSVALEMLVSRLIDNLRRSMKCKSECKKLEEVVGKNRYKLERLARGLDGSKRNGQVWVALDEWCVDMRDLLVGANEIVHECQSGSGPFNLVFSARLATRLHEVRMRIEDKLNHTTVLETILEGSANALQHCHSSAANSFQGGQFSAAYTPQHGHRMVQTTFPVASPQNVATSMGTMHSSPGWNEHFSGALPSHDTSGTSHPHHSHPTIVGISSVYQFRRLSRYPWGAEERAELRKRFPG